VRERLTTLLCALGALLLFTTLFLRGTALEAQPAVLPTSLETRGDGLAGAISWLREEGVRALSLRERFDTIPGRRDLPPRGNLLIVSLPVATAYRETETRALDKWIRGGNTLLVLAAMSDRPKWGRGSFTWYDLHTLTGFSFIPAPADKDARASAAQPRRPAAREGGGVLPPARSKSDAERKHADWYAREVAASRELTRPEASTLVPNRPHPFLREVQSAIAWSDFPRQTWVWSPELPPDGFALSLAREGGTNDGVLWIRPAGDGTIILSGFGSLFSNRSLGLADNARLLANVVATTVGDGGAVLFDDEHQGVTAAYDPAKFYKDSRLYATLGVLIVVWLIWVLGGTQLRLPVTRLAAPREAELVQSTGGFLARVLRPAAAARRMYELFFQRLGTSARDAAREGPRWEWLERHPRLARADVQQLKEWYAQCHADERVPLIPLHNLLVRTARQLAA